MQKRCQYSKSEEISKIVQSAVIRESKTGKLRGQRAERGWGKRGKRGKERRATAGNHDLLFSPLPFFRNLPSFFPATNIRVSLLRVGYPYDELSDMQASSSSSSKMIPYAFYKGTFPRRA